MAKSSQDLMEQLDKLKLDYKEAIREKQKEIAKQKRKERNDFVKAVGKIAVTEFPDIKTEEDFKRLFEIMKKQRVPELKNVAPVITE